MLRIILIFIILFYVISRFILPFFAFLLAKQVKDQINGQANDFNKKSSSSMKENPAQGEYIEYEEVKEK